MDIYVSIGWFVIVLLVMLVLHRWLEIHIQRLAYAVSGHPAVAIWIFFVVSFPGTLVHELSHWLAAKLLFVPTGRVVLWPQRKSKDHVWLGSVQIGRADPLRGSLIGLAPLVSGSILITLIGYHLRLNELGQAIAVGRLAPVWESISQAPNQPDFWIWLYLLFAIANRMLPSPTDWRDWLPTGLFLAALSLIMLAFDWMPDIGPDARNVIKTVMGFLIYSFSLAVATDVLVGILVAVLEFVVGLFRRHQTSH